MSLPCILPQNYKNKARERERITADTDRCTVLVHGVGDLVALAAAAVEEASLTHVEA